MNLYLEPHKMLGGGGGVQVCLGVEACFVGSENKIQECEFNCAHVQVRA